MTTATRCPVQGAAYLTPVFPLIYTTDDDVAAVYAVFPPAQYLGGETTFLIVSSSALVGDTVVFPCDRAGQLVGPEMFAHVTVPNHVAALRAAGYELEAVTPRA